MSLSLPSCLATLCIVVGHVPCVVHNNASAAPLSFAPSMYWDGIDGSWSTFALKLRTPPQIVRLLPSITGNTIWATLSQACQDSSVSTCLSDRGGTFATNASSTWEDKGMFQLPLDPEHYLPFNGAAHFGFDNVTLDWQGYGGMTLENQVVAGYTTDDFYIGALGLSPLPVHITSFDDQYPSFLGTLSAENHIPSYSYGYTAGASYRSFPLNTFGSLAFGGYDSTRMDVSKNLTITGGTDSYRPMLIEIEIERIISGSVDLLDAPIITALNSIVAHIWLPISACQRFETAFGLVWNSTNELYIVNGTYHSTLLAPDASITLTLSTGSQGDKDNILDITLPYAAFDLMAKPPYTGLKDTAYYFPLKRAANNTQYTLGRTFLQETYMIADYERGVLSLFPAVFPHSDVERHLIPILPVKVVLGPRDTGNNEQSGLSRTAIIGIIVGGIVCSVFAAAGAFFFIQRKWQEKAGPTSSEASSLWETAELASSPTHYRSQLEGHILSDVALASNSPNVSRGYRSSSVQEMPGDHAVAELGPHHEGYELHGFQETTQMT